MSESDEKVLLDEENITLVTSVIKNALIGMPEEYLNGFDEYITDYLVSDTLPLDGEDEYAEFWQNMVLCFVKRNSASLEEIHNSWVEELAKSGWGFNTKFDYQRKTCPWLINFHNLSFHEVSLIRLIAGIIWALVVKAEPEIEDGEAS